MSLGGELFELNLRTCAARKCGAGTWGSAFAYASKCSRRVGLFMFDQFANVSRERRGGGGAGVGRIVHPVVRRSASTGNSPTETYWSTANTAFREQMRVARAEYARRLEAESERRKSPR